VKLIEGLTNYNMPFFGRMDLLSLLCILDVEDKVLLFDICNTG